MGYRLSRGGNAAMLPEGDSVRGYALFRSAVYSRNLDIKVKSIYLCQTRLAGQDV